MRLSILGLFLALTGACSLTARPIVRHDYSFSDVYGNTISIENIKTLPTPLDTSFFKLNLTGLNFNFDGGKPSDNFNYSIVSIKPIKKEKEFELRVRSVPKSNDIERILKNYGYSYYRLKLKVVNKKFQIESVDFLRVEI